ncbi:MAG: TlpA family protein disulfide reductase [Frankiaceae bacterium]
MTGLWVLLGVVVAVCAAGAVHRARTGRLRPVRAAAPAASAGAEGGAGVDRPSGSAAEIAALADVGVRPGEAGVTLLQFSSAFCAPCRATRRILADVAAVVPGVRHVEVDAESHLPAVRALGIVRTPTTLLVDAGGRVVRRAAGPPRKEQVLAAVAELLDADGAAAAGLRPEPGRPDDSSPSADINL